MANYSQISFGSKNDDVTELQNLLKNNGYKDLAIDGNFGSQTQAAVKDYQEKKGLAVDGIVGPNTWAALTKDKNSAQTAPESAATAPAETKASTFEYKPSDTVAQAEALLQQQLANKPGEFQSPWQSQLNDTLQKILNREKFSYDLNGDLLYQQYKDQYTTQGKLAMMDTMGQAAAMTGGYGNSYAQSVGQQAYQGYLQQINDKIPELYQLALSQYNQEGQDLYNQYGLYADREQQDYGRYRDRVSDYNTELGRLTEDARYKAEQDYGRWGDNYAMTQDKYDKLLGLMSIGYTPTDEELTSAGMTRAQADAVLAAYGASSGDSGQGSGGWDNSNLNENKIQMIQHALGVTADGKWGAQSRAAAGGLSADEAWEAFFNGTLGNPVGTSAEWLEQANMNKNGNTSVDTENTKLFRSSIMTSQEFARHGNKATVKGKTYSSYKSYIEACLADWTDNDVPHLGKNLTDEEVNFLMDYYGL